MAACAALLAAAAGSVAAHHAPGGASGKPHIVILFADNMGWANVGFRRPPGADPREYATPNVVGLADEGIVLDRHYTYKFCSPSRSALMSGRLPIHVNIYNDDPARPGAGVPVGMTLLPEKLAAAGYDTHFVGKWHLGMASRSRQPPERRGFKSSLGYFHSHNNYYNTSIAEGCGGRPAVDLWDTGRPGAALNGTAYEEKLFADRAVSIIETHTSRVGATMPLFLYYAFHSSCVGWQLPDDALQADPEYYERFAFVDNNDRRRNNAMVAFMDDSVGRVVAALRASGMWGMALVLWASDNGGAVHLGGGANAYPLRGGYYNNWEGGIRTSAVLSGGYLRGRVPVGALGGRLEGFIHEADWYATFCGIVGVSAADPAATARGLPGVDSLDMWPLITGANTTSPRVEWPLTPRGEEYPRSPWGGDAAYIAEGRYKLIVGKIGQAGWCGATHPNSTLPWDSHSDILDCSPPGKIGCLFDILADPEERRDLALTLPAKAASILKKLEAAEALWFDPDRGMPDPRACDVADATGFWQPFLP